MVISYWSAQSRGKGSDKSTQKNDSICTLTIFIKGTDWINLESFTWACAHCHGYVSVSRCKLIIGTVIPLYIFCDDVLDVGCMNRCQ